VTVKKCGCNFSVKIKVLKYYSKIIFRGRAFLKFSKNHEFKKKLKCIKSGFSVYVS